MTYFTTTLAVVAGACLALGLLYGFVGARRVADRTADVLFAAFSFAYAGAVLSARAVYLAESPTSARSLDQSTALFASLGFALLLLFVVAYTRSSRGWGVVARLLSATFIGIGVVSAVAPDLVVGEASSVDRVELPWGEQVLVSSAAGAALEPAVLVAQLAAIVVITAMTIAELRRGDRERAVFLVVGIGWFVATLVVDVLVDVGVVDFVYLSDVGFVGFVVGTSLQLAKSAMDTEDELRGYQGHLEEMVDEQTAQLKSAQAELLAQTARKAAEDERTRLSRDLHDAVTQLLFSVNLIAQSLPQLYESDPEQAKRSSVELVRLSRGALAEMRTLLRELRPHTIVETDLGVLITQVTQGLAARHDLTTHITTSLGGPVPSDVHVATYRVAQEAVNNVAKHAGAGSLSVGLTGRGESVHLSVADDGCGFDTSAVPTGSMGLRIMAERAAEIGARLSVTSEPAGGTTVTLDWPVAPAGVGHE